MSVALWLRVSYRLIIGGSSDFSLTNSTDSLTANSCPVAYFDIAMPAPRFVTHDPHDGLAIHLIPNLGGRDIAVPDELLDLPAQSATTLAALERSRAGSLHNEEIIVPPTPDVNRAGGLRSRMAAGIGAPSYPKNEPATS